MSISNLDWNKIESFERMQRLVNDLFAFETNMLEFIPSSPEIGADGGFDGLVEGVIPFLKISDGATMLQSKYFRNHLKPAEVRDKIRSDLEGSEKKKGEIQKATEKGCNSLVLATNGKLKSEYIKELEALKPNNLKNLVILDQEKLRTQIVQHPFLLLYYFSKKVHPTFVPPKIYLENKEKSLNDFSIERKDNEIGKKMEQFLQNKDRMILHMHAPGGYGKSHIISRIALGKFSSSRDREILLVDNSYRPIEKALEEEIIETSSHKYLIIFDDIDRDMNSLTPLLKLIASGSSVDIKLIISSRSSSQYAIQRELVNYQLRSKTQIEALNDWSDSELESILKHFNPNIEDAKAQFIVRRYRNPYIISWVAKKIKGDDLDPKDLHDRLFQQLNTDVKYALTGLGLTDSQIDKLLFNTLTILPFVPGHQETYNKLADLIQIDPNLVEDIFEKLVSVGFMRIIAGQLRMNPDLKGDIALQSMIASKPKSEIIENFRMWAPSHLNNLLFNINSASYYGEVDKLNDLLIDEVNSWINSVKNNEILNIKQLLKLSEYIARFLPIQTANFFEVLVNKSENLGLSTDDLGPLMKILRNHPDSHTQVLKLLINEYHAVKEGTYSNYKADDIAKDFLNPLPKYNTYGSLESTLEFYNQHKEGKETASAKIILTSLAELLAASHEHEESYGISITFGRRTLKKDDRLISIRQKALNIILYYISECHESTYLLALEAADKIGESIGSVGTSETELHDTFITEQIKVIENLDLSKVKDLSLGTQVKFEDFLFEWWAQEKGANEEAFKLIESIERDLLFYVVKSLKSRNFVGKDLQLFLNYEPKERVKNSKESRWNWFVNVTFDQEYETEAIKTISNDLATKIKTPDELVMFLKRVSECIDSDDWKPYAFITHWVPLNADLFIDTHKQEWSKVPIIFKPAIESAIILNNKAYLQDIVREYKKNIKNKSLHEISVMLEGVAKFDSERFYEICKFVIHKTGLGHSAIIADSVWRYYRHTKDVKNSLLLLKQLLTKNKRFTPRSIDYVQFVVTDIAKDNHNFKFSNNFRNLLIKLLKRYPEAEHDFTTILDAISPTLEEIIDIVDFRLRLQEKISSIRYRSYYNPPASTRERIKRLLDQLKKNLSYLLTFPYEYMFLRSDLKNFDAFPHHGLTDIKLPINTYEDYQFYLDFLNKTESEIVLGMFDIDHLSSNVTMMGKDEDPPWYELYLRHVIEQKEIKKMLFLLDSLPISALNRSEAAAILDRIYNELVSNKDKKSYGSILWSKAISGGYSRAIGETPPQLLERKQTFTELRETCKILENKEILGNIIIDIENQINSHNEHDEEILYER